MPAGSATFEFVDVPEAVKTRRRFWLLVAPLPLMPIDQPVDVDRSPKRRKVCATRWLGRTQNSAEMAYPARSRDRSPARSDGSRAEPRSAQQHPGALTAQRGEQAACAAPVCAGAAHHTALVADGGLRRRGNRQQVEPLQLK